MMVPDENVEQYENDSSLFPCDFNCQILFSDEHINSSNNESGSATAIDAHLSTYEKNTIIVKVLNPEKVGEGMSSYVVYTIRTTTNMKSFKKPNMCVQRRFSDFLGLYEKLKEKYLHLGVVIPCPPEKNVFGTTKIRLSKSTSADSDFIEKRRVSLECFLHRIINHPALVKDTDVHEFLELEGELPRGISGQGISGASAMKLLKNVGEAVGKLTFRMDESDEYFDMKDEELAIWEVQGSRLYAALSNLVLDQTDLAASTLASSKALSVFANVEEHTGLARALGQLADTEEQIAHFLSVEAEVQSTFLVEYAKGVLSMIQACRDTLGERVRLFKTHRDCESSLRSKREQKVRIEMSPKADRARIPILEREIDELQHKVDESEEDFEKISATIKKEFEHVDEARFEEFKAATLSYLTMILQMQEKVGSFFGLICSIIYAMTDDRPIGGGGGYKINWDEIDENTNPFGVGNAFGGNKLASSPSAGRAPPVQPDSPPVSDLPVLSEDPPLNPSGKEIVNEVRHVLDPSVTEFGDAKSVPKELKSHNKGPRPAPPKRTVSKGNSQEAEDRNEIALDNAKFGNQIPNIVDIPPPEEFVPEELFTIQIVCSLTAFSLVTVIAVSNMTSFSTKPQVGNPLVRGHSRRASNSSSATFDLVSGNQSPLPEPEPDHHSLSADEELLSLRADKQHLTTVVADMQRCIAEYERSLRQLAEEKARAEESAKESVIDIIAERDQAIEEISTIEKAFGDLHRRFEKSKQIIEGFKTNEEALKKTAQEYQDQLKRQEQKYQSLKVHAEQQLTKVAEETERAKRANEDEVTRLRAAIKRSELRIHSLESQLQQKARSDNLI
ncbi:unnamed protein product [Rodentolepis nana]|uniref:PX domain-containing protein n=1 Tax=Rodentolepis nana TaxID=102285 RepID=A0A0R3T2D7_RODNA|nr:unnamed protein product [Rodentolepis nana]